MGSDSAGWFEVGVEGEGKGGEGGIDAMSGAGVGDVSWHGRSLTMYVNLS